MAPTPRPLFGVAPPSPGARRSDVLRYIRQIELRSTSIAVVVTLLLALLVGSTFLVVVAAVVAIFSALHITWLTVSAKRLSRRGL